MVDYETLGFIIGGYLVYLATTNIYAKVSSYLRFKAFHENTTLALKVSKETRKWMTHLSPPSPIKVHCVLPEVQANVTCTHRNRSTNFKAPDDQSSTFSTFVKIFSQVLASKFLVSDLLPYVSNLFMPQPVPTFDPRPILTSVPVYNGTHELLNVPVNLPVELPVNHPVELPVAPPVNLPVAHPVNLPVEHPVNLPVASPVNLPVNFPVNLPVVI